GVTQEAVVTGEVDGGDRHLGGGSPLWDTRLALGRRLRPLRGHPRGHPSGRSAPAALEVLPHGCGADRLLALDERPEALVDSRLALSGRQLQDRQILPRGDLSVFSL